MAAGSETEHDQKGYQHRQSYSSHPAQVPSAEPTHRRRQQKAQQDSKGDRDNDVASKIQKCDD